MPLHLSTLDKLGVALTHLKDQFSSNSTIRNALSQRVDVLLTARTQQRAASLESQQRLESVPDYRGWCAKFPVGVCPASLTARDWVAEFRNGQPLDSIVRNAFCHNIGLKIDLIVDRQRGSLKSAEWRANGRVQPSMDRMTAHRHPFWIRPEHIDSCNPWVTVVAAPLWRFRGVTGTLSAVSCRARRRSSGETRARGLVLLLESRYRRLAR